MKIFSRAALSRMLPQGTGKKVIATATDTDTKNTTSRATRTANATGMTQGKMHVFYGGTRCKEDQCSNALF